MAALPLKLLWTGTLKHVPARIKLTVAVTSKAHISFTELLRRNEKRQLALNSACIITPTLFRSLVHIATLRKELEPWHMVPLWLRTCSEHCGFRGHQLCGSSKPHNWWWAPCRDGLQVNVHSWSGPSYPYLSTSAKYLRHHKMTHSHRLNYA